MTQTITDQQRRDALEQLSALVGQRAEVDREFRRAVGTLPADLAHILQSLVDDPLSWRLNRSFHIVHVPSLTAILSMLDSVDQMASVSEDERHQVLTSLNRAATLAKEARSRLERQAFSETKVELDVLAEYASPPAQPYQKPSRLTRAFDSVSAASDAVWSSAKSGVDRVPDVVGSLHSGVSDTVARAASVPKLVGTLQKSVSGSLSDTIATPISMRLNAGGRALRNGVGAGVGLGVVAGVLCPPLLPLSAGGAVLAAMRTWRKEMDKASALNAEERQQRVAELQAERDAALRQLTHGASALQMETEELSMTLDVETGEADAVVLQGEHSGRTWSSLSKREKAETGLLLLEGAGEILSIVDTLMRD